MRDTKMPPLVASLLLLFSVLLSLGAASDAKITNKEIAGYIDISGSRPGYTEGSELFYWLTPSQSSSNSDQEKPLLMWLNGKFKNTMSDWLHFLYVQYIAFCEQSTNSRILCITLIYNCNIYIGGPGSTSLLGLFFENGPYYLNSDNCVENRTVGNWNQEFNVLYLDQPIGTGYSVAGSENAYANNEEDVAADMYYFLQQWLKAYPQYKDAPFFITGESYAGHYIPALSTKILLENEELKVGNQHINLVAVAIGDGLTDPCSQVEAGPRAAFDFGLVDAKTFAKAKEYALSASSACAAQDWALAHDMREKTEDTVLDASKINKYDVRTFDDYKYMDQRMDVYLNKDSTKIMLNVPLDRSFGTDSQVSTHLYDDVMQSQADKFPFMLDNIRVLLYQGQFDWKDGPFSNEKWIERIDWPGKVNYMAAPRKPWLSCGDVFSGWVQSYGTLSEVIVNAAGHLVPMNQPERVLDMISTFVEGREFTTAE